MKMLKMVGVEMKIKITGGKSYVVIKLCSDQSDKRFIVIKLREVKRSDGL